MKKEGLVSSQLALLPLASNSIWLNDAAETFEKSLGSSALIVNRGFLFSLRITSSSNLLEPSLFLLGFKKFPAQLNVLSDFAELQGMESTALATLDRSGRVFS